MSQNSTSSDGTDQVFSQKVPNSPDVLPENAGQGKRSATEKSNKGQGKQPNKGQEKRSATEKPNEYKRFCGLSDKDFEWFAEVVASKVVSSLKKEYKEMMEVQLDALKDHLFQRFEN